jgi:hypothetical protein
MYVPFDGATLLASDAHFFFLILPTLECGSGKVNKWRRRCWCADSGIGQQNQMAKVARSQLDWILVAAAVYSVVCCIPVIPVSHAE